MERQDEPKINSILSYTWYPHDMPMTPHLIWPAIEVFARARYGLGYSIGSLFIKDRNGRYGFAEEDLDRVGRFFFDNPLEILKLASAWEEKKSAYKSEIKKIRNLTMLSEKEMHSLYHGFYTAYVGQYSIPALANTLDFYFENWLKAIADPQDFFKLTAPAKESFIQREQKELLSIRKNKDFGANIENHAKKYFWLGNNYSHTKILSKDYFIRRHETEKYAEISKPDKKDLMKKYKISESLMKAVEECIYWRDERKKLNMIGNHYLCVLLEEIGKRKGISLEDMKYTLPSEIENPDKEKIKLRKFSFLVIIKKDEEIFFYGSEAQEMHDKMFKIHKGEVTEIHGRPACLGKATGIVKVIMNESEFSKMQQGDILVTSMTRPEFVPIMRKAAAIVTDEGGITCHAAIVSRELKIPCIISTRIATQKLKDGDKVEVDAEKGMIRKL